MIKALLFVAAQAFFIQTILSLPIIGDSFGPWDAATRLAASPYGLPYAPYRFIRSPASLSASNCGGLVVTSASPMEASGVSILSQNYIEGLLTVLGEVPFLGSVALDGVLPTVGSGAVTYNCGDGPVAMVAEEYPSDYERYAAPFAYGAYGFDGYRLMY